MLVYTGEVAPSKVSKTISDSNLLQVVIAKDNVEQFLEAANELKIAGLTKSNNSKQEDEDDQVQTIEDDSVGDEPGLEEEKVKEKSQNHRKSTTSEIESNNNECDICGAGHKSGKAFMKHRQVEHPGRNFYCRQCGNEFKSNNNLKLHKRAVHEKLTIPCDICERPFTNKSNLSFHKKKMHGIKKEVTEDSGDDSLLFNATEENESIVKLAEDKNEADTKNSESIEDVMEDIQEIDEEVDKIISVELGSQRNDDIMEEAEENGENQMEEDDVMEEELNDNVVELEEEEDEEVQEVDEAGDDIQLEVVDEEEEDLQDVDDKAEEIQENNEDNPEETHNTDERVTEIKQIAKVIEEIQEVMGDVDDSLGAETSTEVETIEENTEDESLSNKDELGTSAIEDHLSENKSKRGRKSIKPQVENRSNDLDTTLEERDSHECDICGAEHKSGKAMMSHR